MASLEEEARTFLAANPQVEYLDAFVIDLCGRPAGKRYPLSQIEKLFKNGSQLCASTTLLDVNGDGRSDWITAARDTDGNETLETWLNTDSGWESDSGYTPPSALMLNDPVNQTQAMVGEAVDLNGDGLMDWVEAWSDGNGEVRQTWINIDQDRSTKA